MNRIKSVFIGVYLTYAFIIGIIHLLTFIDTLELTWLISAAIHFIPVGYIVKLYIVDTPRTSLRLAPITVSIIALTIFASLVMQQAPTAYPNIYIYILITFFGWLLYLSWYSKLTLPNEQVLKSGVPLPELNFEDVKRNTVSTNNYKGSPTIYLFYRGNWCPLCMAQIKELASDYQALADKGAQVVLISPQPHGHTNRLAKKHDVPFIYLTDPKGASAKLLQIYHPSGVPMGLELLGYASDTVFPTVVITDKTGLILFVDQTDNYRIRPEPSLFLDVLEGKHVSAV